MAGKVGRLSGVWRGYLVLGFWELAQVASAPKSGNR
jgi:hypothetical protein